MSNLDFFINRVRNYRGFVHNLTEQYWRGSIDNAQIMLLDDVKRLDTETAKSHDELVFLEIEKISNELQSIAQRFDQSKCIEGLQVLTENLGNICFDSSFNREKQDSVAYFLSDVEQHAIALAAKLENLKAEGILSEKFNDAQSFELLTPENIRMLAVNTKALTFTIETKDGVVFKNLTMSGDPAIKLAQASFVLFESKIEINIEEWMCYTFGVESRSRNPVTIFKKANQSTLFNLLYKQIKSKRIAYRLHEYVSGVKAI